MTGAPDSALFDAWDALLAPGAAFEMEPVFVRGETLRHYVAAPADAREVWRSTAGLGERACLVFGDERLSYAKAHAMVANVAAWLAGRGIAQGDRVAIAMRNYPEWVLAYWACQTIGAVAVGINAWWVADELGHALRDSRPSAIFCDAERLDRLAETGMDGEMLVVGVRSAARAGITDWDEIAATPGRVPDIAIDPDDDACILYTSGTSGRPKGARLTHRGCVNSLMNMAFQAAAQALATGRAEPVQPAFPVALVTTPLFHVTAKNCLLYPVTAAGGTAVLMHKWDALEALRLIERERVTITTGVPTMARELIGHPRASEHDLSSLAMLSGGGAPVPPDLVEKIDAHPSPAQPSTGFGMTETSGVATAVTGPFFVRRPGSAGRVLPTFDARVIGDAGEVLPAGSVGELCLRGVGVIPGYLNAAEATADAIQEGWLRTGDLARIDADGFVHIVDRKKDMVLRGGENVYCAEVEAALFRHPAIAEACVFGVPDERLGEEVGAAIVLRDGAQADAGQLRAHLAGLVARFKVPRYLWLCADALPRNASGKFMRRELRAMLRVEDAA